MSFESVKQKGMFSSPLKPYISGVEYILTDCPSAAPHRMSNLDQVHKLLQGSYSTMPQPQDTEK